MADIPVGKSEDEEKSERAMDAFKQSNPRSKARADIAAKAGKYLAEINENLANGLVYFVVGDDEAIEMPEKVMALMLAGQDVEAKPKPEDKPMVVTKGPPIMEGDKR
jgi:hypothetical protein